MIIVFFFLIIRRPPSSTLFPTRRSSDLADRIAREVGAPWMREHIRPLLASDTERSVGEVIASAEAIDRKSTRLNSSHEWISYAVFCLKKKNNGQEIYGSKYEKQKQDRES